MLVILESL